jgi:hypothetical protein
MSLFGDIGGWLGLSGEEVKPQQSAQSLGDMVSSSAGTFANRNAGQDRQQLQDFYSKLQNANAPRTQAASAGPAALAQNVQLGPAAQMNAASSEAANAGPAATARAANINQGNANQVRDQQMALNQNLAGIVNGAQSGMGANQLAQAQASNLAAANALAQSGRTGQNANLIARNLANSTANVNSQAAAQAAQTALQEQQAARSALGQNLAQVAGQDIGLATNQAGLNQQANLQNAALGQNMAQFNAGNAQQAALQNAALQQQAGLSNQSALNQFLAAQAQLAQNNNQFNATQGNQMNLSNAQLQQQANLANLQSQQNQNQLAVQGGLGALGGIQNLDQQQVANQMAGVQAQMGLQNNMNNFNLAQAGQNVSGISNLLGGAGSALSGIAMLSDKRKKKKVKSAEKQLDEMLTRLGSPARRVSDMRLKDNITTSFNANPFNQVPQVQAPAAGGSNLGAGMASLGQGIGALMSGSKDKEADIVPTSAPAGYAMPGAQMSMGTAAPQAAGYALPALAPALSDERQKQDKNSVDHALMGMLDKLKAYQYEYKDPDMPGAGHGPQLGILAQDLEKSDAGKMFVKETEEGTKMVEYGKMLPALLASMATMHKRVKGLEGRR